MNTKITLNTRFRVVAVLHILVCVLFIYIVGCCKTTPKDEKANLKATQNPLTAKTVASNDARVYATRETRRRNEQEVTDRPLVMKLQADHDTDVFMVVENMPQFPGGNQARVDFMLKNLKYPVIAKETRATGKMAKMIKGRRLPRFERKLSLRYPISGSVIPSVSLPNRNISENKTGLMRASSFEGTYSFISHCDMARFARFKAKPPVE